MHIVILDGGSTNPGDVSWAPLRALGSVTVSSRIRYLRYRSGLSFFVDSFFLGNGIL